MTTKNKIKARRKGAYLPIILMVSLLFLALTMATISLAMINVKLANNHRDKVLAMDMAEAGVNYYVWHLSHFSGKYCDGPQNNATFCKHYDIDGNPIVNAELDNKEWGYYTHDVVIDGKTIGTYKIKIFPPTADNNVIRIESVGMVPGRSLKRTLISELGMPSYSRYTVFSNGAEIDLHLGERIQGTAFANNSGIFNNGRIDRLATATMVSYSSLIGGLNTPGIAGSGIYGGSSVFPAPQVNYLNILDMQLISLETTNTYDEAGGYHVVLGNGSYTLYQVNDYVGFVDNESDLEANDLEITNQTLIGSYDYPESGLLHFKDNVWVDGDVGNSKITIMAATFDDKNNIPKSIVVNGDLINDKTDGRIGLIAQNNILIKRNVAPELKINANMLAQSGRIFRKDYGDTRDSLEIYGSMAHNAGLSWTYYHSPVTGFKTANLLYDDASALSPPPHFPLTGNYQIQSLREK